MSCFYCHKEGLTIEDQGPCAVCRKDVCTDPPKRPDKRFHGSVCQCSECNCGELVCKYHAAGHAATKGGTVASCFPALAIAGSTRVLGGASAALGAGRTASRLPEDVVKAMTEFLNFVTPGRTALLAARKRTSDSEFKRLATRIDVEDDLWWIDLDPEFYAEGAMERVAALSARTMGEAWRSASEHTTPSTGMAWISRALSRAMGVAYDEEALTVPGIERLLAVLVSEQRQVPPSLIRAIAYTDVPEGADAIADWIAGATVKVGQLMEMT